jgi:hypothetical protein
MTKVNKPLETSHLTRSKARDAAKKINNLLKAEGVEVLRVVAPSKKDEDSLWTNSLKFKSGKLSLTRQV